ncbi:immunoglobulin E-set, partial [Mycena polygramma]
MGATKVSSNLKQPDCRPSRQRAKTLPPVHLSDTISEQDDSMDESSGFRSARDAGAPSTLGGQQRTSQDAFLSRHGTLLSAGATTLKRTVELKSLLGNVNSRLPPGAQILRQPHGQEESTSLEQAKSRARVEIDIVPYSNVCVEGGIFKGFIKLRIRPRMSKESAVSISDGKLRIIGFETVEGDYHEFLQYSAAISTVTTSPLRMYISPPDSEGFCEAQEGVHKLEFEMPLPMGGVRRPKGPFYGHSGIAVRYIALVSIKVKDEFNKRSIAHFYRDCEIWPRLNPSVILAPAEQPIKATTSKSLFMGGNGLVQLTATLHRSSFVAGALVNVDVEVKNDSKKLIKSLTLTLYRSTVVFKRKIPRDPNSVVRIDIDASQTATTRKVVASSTLEMTQGFPRGHASAGGWWAGIPSGERLAFSHLLLIPPDALTHTREQLIEVEYMIRVSLNAKTLTTDVCVDLPIRIVNLLSLDPPPSCNERSQGQPSNIRQSQSQTLPANSAPTSPLYDHYGDFCDSDASEEDCDKSHSEDGSQPEAQLGNLSMREDAEDLVHHAIVSAQIDDRPEQALQDECIE